MKLIRKKNLSFLLISLSNLLVASTSPAQKRETPAVEKKQSKVHKYGALVVRFTPSSEQSTKTISIPINEDSSPVAFETKFFKGRCVVRVKDAEGAPETEYFKGKKRLFSLQVEGQFKKEISADQVWYGTTFSKPLKIPKIMKTGLAFAKTLNPSFEYKLEPKKESCFLSPLISGADRISITTPPQKTPIPWVYGGAMKIPEQEHSYYGLRGKTKRETWHYKERRDYYAKKENRIKTSFNSEYVYSFDFLSKQIDFNSFTFYQWPFPGTNLVSYLNHQPIRFEARVLDKTGAPIGVLWSIEFIHDDLTEN